MRRLQPALVRAPLIAALGIACSAERDDYASSSEPVERKARPLVENEPFLWAEQPYEEYRTGMSEVGSAGRDRHR